jgi:hypothetical protein
VSVHAGSPGRGDTIQRRRHVPPFRGSESLSLMLRYPRLTPWAIACRASGPEKKGNLHVAAAKATLRGYGPASEPRRMRVAL